MRRMTEQNPWWSTGEVRRELCPPYERPGISKVLSSLPERFVMLLRGPRRTGKSTLLYQAIRHLLGSGTEPRAILYFSFDGNPGTVQELLDLYRDTVLGRPIPAEGRVYLFLDEVQKCKGWSEEVKRNYDLFPNLKFVLSGSVSFDMVRGSTESLAGRAVETKLMPMSFAEYLGLRGIPVPARGAPLREFLLAEEGIRPYFAHYLTSGGFPEMATVSDPVRIRDYVLSSVVQRVVYGDLAQAGGGGDSDAMMATLRAISEMPGMLLNFETLGSSLGKDRRTVSSYITRMEQAMIIHTLGNVRGRPLVSSRKHRKAYPVSTALTYAFKDMSLEDTDVGRIVETAVLNEIGARFFWREGRDEVDFIVGSRGETAVEVKLGAEGPFHFERWAEKRALKRAYVVTRDASGTGHSGSVGFEKVPAWALCAGAQCTDARET